MSKRPSFKLKFGDVDPYPFVNAQFEVTVMLCDENGNFRNTDPTPFTLKAGYAGDKTGQECHPPVMAVDHPSQLVVPSSGTLRVRLRMLDLSMSHDNRKFVLHANANNSFAGQYVAPAMSDPVTVVRHKLTLKSSLAANEVWFKDEGGRDKCIEMTIQMEDRDGNPVTERRVPLRITLLYENRTVVQKQDVLKISPDSSRAIENGVAQLRLRLEDVSKNHQKQRFAIRVAPDYDAMPDASDVSPVISPAMEVRSKRNNKRSRGDAFGMVLPPAPPGPYTQRSNSSVINPDASPATALTKLSNWASKVATQLQLLQWTQIGNQSYINETGELVVSAQPLYAMPNPNSIIAEILHDYNTKVAKSFTILCDYHATVLEDNDPNFFNFGSATPPSLAAVPSFTNNMSSSIAMPSNTRQNSLFCGAEFSLTADEAIESEGCVSFILAQNVVDKRTGENFGLPSFDANYKLVGFYKMADDSPHATQAEFTPRSSLPSETTSKLQILEIGIDGDDDLKSRDTYAPHVDFPDEVYIAWMKNRKEFSLH